MVIDFHTHVYPEKIADKAMKALLEAAPQVRAYRRGDLSGLLDSMELSGTDLSVVLPVATRKGQFDSITKYASEINKKYENLVSFGGIHPDDEDKEEKLGYLKKTGFCGIKIHPDYTGTFIDDERYIEIISICARLGLMVVTHSGVDPAFDVVHCPPEKGRKVMDRVAAATGVSEPFMIFAHLGGMLSYEDVMKYLAGSCCYIDISCSFASLSSYCETSDDQVVELIKAHGAHRILFATDSPWNDQKEYIRHFKGLRGLSDREKDMILFENAQNILKAGGAI